MPRKWEPKDLPTIHAGRVWEKLIDAIDDITQGCLGFRVSERHKLENTIARLAVILSKPMDEEQREVVLNEFNQRVAEYEADFHWTNERKGPTTYA